MVHGYGSFQRRFSNVSSNNSIFPPMQPMCHDAFPHTWARRYIFCSFASTLALLIRSTTLSSRLFDADMLLRRGIHTAEQCSSSQCCCSPNTTDVCFQSLRLALLVAKGLPTGTTSTGCNTKRRPGTRTGCTTLAPGQCRGRMRLLRLRWGRRTLHTVPEEGGRHLRSP